jgi:hypothetical protein
MPDFIEQLRFRLLELGGPIARMQRAVQEVEDHRDDLAEAAMAEGMTAAAAKARAEENLGNPNALAEDLMKSWQRSNWCGRHSFTAFGLMPLLLFPVVWLSILLLCLSAEFAVIFHWDEKMLHVAADNPATLARLTQTAYGTDYFSIALVVFIFCLLGHRSSVSPKWMTLAGLICTFYALFTYTNVGPHHFSVGSTFKPQWIRACVPLLVMAAAYWNRRRLVRRALKISV